MFFDFTLKTYRFLLEKLLSKDYSRSLITVSDFMRLGNYSPRCVIMRHDVDDYPQNAISMARLESTYGVKATYYFRYTHRTFLPPVMQEIQALGHEVGYHYETLDKTNGNFEQARRLFIQEIAYFRKEGLQIKTVCSHGNPGTKKTNYAANHDLLYAYPRLLKECELIGEAYLDINFDKLLYLTDSYVSSFCLNKRPYEIGSSQDVLEAICNTEKETVYLLIHPNHWSDNPIFVLQHRLILTAKAHLIPKPLKKYFRRTTYQRISGKLWR